MLGHAAVSFLLDVMQTLAQGYPLRLVQQQYPSYYDQGGIPELNSQ